MVLTRFFRLFVNCSGLMKSYNLEKTKSVLSFLMFKAMRILVLKLSKFRKPKAESVSLDDFDEVVSSF